LTDEVRASTPVAILRGPTPILGPRGCFMFGSAVQYGDLDTRDCTVDSSGGTPAGARGTALDDREEYVMWGFTARREKFSLPNGDEALDSRDLKSAVERVMGDWHPALRGLVERTDPSVIKTFTVKTSVPVRPWKTRNVTLLGDALHNMPPFRGVGANAALWDAAALHKAMMAHRKTITVTALHARLKKAHVLGKIWLAADRHGSACMEGDHAAQSAAGKIDGEFLASDRWQVERKQRIGDHVIA
jgi:hypothetical protein